jgi:hypothetical protein
VLIALASRASARTKAAAQQARLAYWKGACIWANFVPANPEPVQLLAALAAAAFVGARGISRRIGPGLRGTSLLAVRRSRDTEKDVVSNPI